MNVMDSWVRLLTPAMAEPTMGPLHPQSFERMHMRFAKTLSLTAAVAGLALSTGCTSTRVEQHFIQPSATINVNYTIVRNVEGKGEATKFCPISGGPTASDIAVGAATADAVGTSQDLDTILAPKTTVSETNLIIFSSAKATVKGYGVKLQPAGK